MRPPDQLYSTLAPLLAYLQPSQATPLLLLWSGPRRAVLSLPRDVCVALQEFIVVCWLFPHRVWHGVVTGKRQLELEISAATNNETLPPH